MHPDRPEVQSYRATVTAAVAAVRHAAQASNVGDTKPLVEPLGQLNAVLNDDPTGGQLGCRTIADLIDVSGPRGMDALGEWPVPAILEYAAHRQRWPELWTLIEQIRRVASLPSTDWPRKLDIEAAAERALRAFEPDWSGRDLYELC